MNNQTQKTLLVTGGAGYIGSHTVRMLADKGYKVIVLDNLVYGHKEAIVNKEVSLIIGDLGNKELVNKIFLENKIDAVIHFAAYAFVGESVSNPSKYYQNNIAAPLNLLDVMMEHGCKKFIFSSTCATYGNPQYTPIDEKHPQNPINPYGQSKLMLEKIIMDYQKAYGLEYVFLRYFNASGASTDGLIGEDHNPETHLIPLIIEAGMGKRSNITVFGADYDTPDGSGIRDYIHILDLGRAHLLAFEHLMNNGASLACNLGTGVGYSVKEVINVVEQVTGLKIPVVIGDRRPGDPARLVANPQYAKDALGWEAEYKDLKDTVATAWKWHSNSKQGKF
ncbi:MAG: UDP-glucose 4-epimerase GalE [Cytophagales bacterium]|nr:MAG: UDP-glucose 4-epimerase GalE [Cytophagales bacterium]